MKKKKNCREVKTSLYAISFLEMFEDSPIILSNRHREEEKKRKWQLIEEEATKLNRTSNSFKIT